MLQPHITNVGPNRKNKTKTRDLKTVPVPSYWFECEFKFLPHPRTVHAGLQRYGGEEEFESRECPVSDEKKAAMKM